MTKIIAVSTLKAPYQYNTTEIITALRRDWFPEIPEREHRKFIKIFEGAEIDTRSSVLPLDEVFKETSFEAKNDIYVQKCIELGQKVLEEALLKSNLKPQDIDIIITTSCTGFMIPSLDAYLINNLKMRKDIIRLPLTEMGCAGGTSSLTYAHQFAKNNPDLRVAIVSVELPSLTFQRSDLSLENVVSTAIFADGASCVIMGPTDDVRPEITDTNMYHFNDATHLMGYQLKNTGLKIILDRDIPEEIEKNFTKFLLPFLDKNHLRVGDVHHYLFHPGGKKIIQMVNRYMTEYGKDVSESINVLKNHGNMSSSTIFFILEKFMNKQIPAGELGYMLAFGPGFSAQSLLLKWI